MTHKRRILPGATLGVFGDGQLARMFAMAATSMGYRIVVFGPGRDGPAAQVAGAHVQASYDDEDRVIDFARGCDAVTVEFENVPKRTLELAAEHAVTRPGPGVLAAAQDRIRERELLDRCGLPAAAHAAVHSADELREAVRRVGAPGVVKSARLGYDGRGQVWIDAAADADSAWAAIATDRALYEERVDFDCELSVLVARSCGGVIRTFGPIENRHVNRILDVSVVPAAVDEGVAGDARDLAVAVAEGLALEGLICVEMFLTPSGRLLVNEIAPRPHNSGHLTIEACDTSQFELQLRALCNLPLPPLQLRQPVAMKNLLGDLWSHAAPDWTEVWRTPGANLHLYGKGTARPGRKMGHLTVLERTRASAVAVAERLVRDACRRPAAGRRPIRASSGGGMPMPTTGRMTTCSC